MHDAPGASQPGLVVRDGAAGEGLRFREGTELLGRAVEALQKSPRSTDDLAREVFGLRSAPKELAERMVDELLGGDDRVRRDEGGVWRLSGGDGAPEGSLSELEYAVVDVETTGTSPGDGARMTEIAVMQVSGGVLVDEFSTLVDPARPIPPWISRLTGITDEMVRDAPAFEEVAPRVRRMLEGRVFVAHNVGFDWRFVTEEMRRASSLLPVGPRLCTLRLARRALPELDRRGLDALAEHYGVEVEDRHRAAGDARATVTILNRLLEEADRTGVSRWSEMRRWLGGEQPPIE